MARSVVPAAFAAAAVGSAVVVPFSWLVGVMHFGFISGPEPTLRLWLSYALFSLPPAIALVGWLLRHFLATRSRRSISLARACAVAAVALAPAHAGEAIITLGEYGYDFAVFVVGLTVSLVTLTLLSARLSVPGASPK